MSMEEMNRVYGAVCQQTTFGYKRRPLGNESASLDAFALALNVS